VNATAHQASPHPSADQDLTGVPGRRVSPMVTRFRPGPGSGSLRTVLGLGAALIAANVVTAVRLRAARAELRAAREELRGAVWQAEHDPLTGLLNRYGAHRHYLQHPEQARTVALLDLDSFKYLNDTYGHHTGDAVLVAIADRLGHAAHHVGGTAARLGGDEFLLQLPANGDTATGQTHTILSAVRSPIEVPLPGDTLTVHPRFSTGLAPRATAWTDALRHADAAMYHAKDAPGSLVAYRDGMHHPTRTRHRH
jgi:diguanylate cyclase (GGDEF)-like protein